MPNRRATAGRSTFKTLSALEIRRNDLNGTLYHHSWGAAPILVLYDHVPGGAGHVQRVADELPAVFAAALQRVESCSCGPETACHECLWNYYNQPYHALLSRGEAAELLRAALGQERLNQTETRLCSDTRNQTTGFISSPPPQPNHSHGWRYNQQTVAKGG